MVLLLMSVAVSSAAFAVGQTGAELLRLQGDAAHTVLGSAATGLQQGLSALAGNPATLNLESWAASVTHYTGFLGLQLQAGSLGQRLDDGKVWALGVTSARLTDLEGRDIAGYPTRSFDTQTWILSYAGAIPLTPQLTVGIGARWYHERLGPVTAQSVLGSLGLLADLNVMTLGFSIEEVGTPLRFDTVAAPLPTTVNFALALPLQDLDLPLMLLGALTWDREGGFTSTLALESTLTSWFTARTSLLPATLPGIAPALALGGGIAVAAFTMDVAWVPHAVLGGTTRLTGSLTW